MVPVAFASAVVSIKEHEGFRGLVYDDASGKLIGPGSVVKGNPTIGYGWALNKVPMSRPHGAWHVEAVLEDNVSELHRRFPWLLDLDPDVLAVLYELAYNLGVDGLSEFRKMFGSLKDGDRHAAAFHLLDSKWRIQVGPTRSQALADRLSGSPPPT
jgi:GH24 family phage-related lysozyme (muramidase)